MEGFFRLKKALYKRERRVKFFKFLWNFLIGLTIYSVFRENPFFKEAIVSLVRSLNFLIRFVVERIQTGSG